MNKTQILKYFKKTELDIQRANASIIACDLVFDSYAQSRAVHKIKYSPVFCYISYKRLIPFYQIIPRKNIDGVGKKIYLDYLKNPGSLIKKIKEHSNLEKQLDRVWQNYQKKRNILSRQDSLKIYQQMIKIARKWWHYGAVGEDKGGVIESEVVPKFVKKYNINPVRALEIINILIHPKVPSVFNEERKSFLRLCLYINENLQLKNYLIKYNFSLLLEDKKLVQKIKEHIKKYFWFKTDFYGAKEITPEVLLKDVLAEIKKRGKPVIIKELKNIDENFLKINKQRKNLLASLRFTKEDKNDIRFSQLVTHWLDVRKLGMMKQFYYILTFVNDIAKKNNLKYHDLAVFTIDEIGDFLASNKRIGGKEVASRHEGVFCVYEENKKAKLFYGKDCEEMFKAATYAEEAKELKGQVACSGGFEKISGKIRVVFKPELEKFYSGEILVTSMTRVEFVSLMRKAKAIITNEGGVACHAAIVSRELGIPCIVGTKAATDIFKNGDVVELNLTNGDIKVLKINKK